MTRIRVACDVGYGFVKAVSESREKVVFPSLVAPVPPNPLEGCGVFEGAVEHEVKFASSARAIHRFVGEAARDVPGAVKPVGAEKVEEVHDALLLAALGILLPRESEAAVDLGLGLPMTHFKVHKEKLEARLAGLAGRVQVTGHPEKKFALSSVTVFPQGLGALVASGAELPLNGQVGVVDIGTYTTDLLLFRTAGGKPVPVREGCRSIPVGVDHIHRALGSAFASQTGEMLPSARHQWVLEKTLAGQLVPFKGEQLDFRAVVSDAVQDMAEAVASEVQACWGEAAHFTEFILLAGGGSELCARHLGSRFPQMRVMKNALFANAEGFLYLVEQRLRLIGGGVTESRAEAV